MVRVFFLLLFLFFSSLCYADDSSLIKISLEPLSGDFSSSSVTINTVARPVDLMRGRKAFLITNDSTSETVFFGNSAVTVALGTPLYPRETIIFNIASGNTVSPGTVFFVSYNPVNVRICEVK